MNWIKTWLKLRPRNLDHWLSSGLKGKHIGRNISHELIIIIVKTKKEMQRFLYIKLNALPSLFMWSDNQVL